MSRPSQVRANLVPLVPARHGRPSRYSSALARDDFQDYAPPEAVATINHEADRAEVVEGVAHQVAAREPAQGPVEQPLYQAHGHDRAADVIEQQEPPAFTRMVYGVYESLDEARKALSEISNRLRQNEPLEITSGPEHANRVFLIPAYRVHYVVCDEVERPMDGTSAALEHHVINTAMRLLTDLP